MEENIGGKSCNSNANKLCYILTGSTNGHFALHLWESVRTNSCWTAHTHTHRHTPLNCLFIATIRANAGLSTLKSKLKSGV